DGDEAIDVMMITKQCFDAAKVAELLLADRGDPHQITDRVDRMGIDHPQDRQQRCEATRIVSNPGSAQDAVVLRDGHVGALRKHGVKVSGNHEFWPSTGASTEANDITRSIDSGLLEAKLGKPLATILGAHALLVWRRRHLGDHPLLRKRARIIGLK